MLVKRVMVTNERGYSSVRQGDLTTDIEGNSRSWRRDPFYLFTTDDADAVAELRGEIAERKVIADLKRAAKSMAAHFENYPSDPTALSDAIHALTACQTALNKEN